MISPFLPFGKRCSRGDLFRVRQMNIAFNFYCRRSRSGWTRIALPLFTYTAIELTESSQLHDIFRSVAFWDEASLAERMILVEDFIDSINIFPYQLAVQVVGDTTDSCDAPMVGLNQGCITVMSEDRRQQSPTGGLLTGNQTFLPFSPQCFMRVFKRSYNRKLSKQIT
jgi:hypothetical protein